MDTSEKVVVHAHSEKDSDDSDSVIEAIESNEEVTAVGEELTRDALPRLRYVREEEVLEEERRREREERDSSLSTHRERREKGWVEKSLPL